MFVEGRVGSAFCIKIRNNSWQRKLFVPTVDGLSVMDGEVGEFESGGYIVAPYSSVEIKGWRTSDDEVAEFFFSGRQDSYSVRLGKGKVNLGVIGVAVFGEKVRQQYYAYPSILPQAPTSSDWEPQFFASASQTCGDNSGSMTNASMILSASANMAQVVGTGFGDRKESHVTSVSFDREASPECVFQIFYNTREELKKLGIDFEKRNCYVSPQAFPGRYCKPPQN